MAAVLIYSVFTAACGFAQIGAQLAVFRVLLGFGMGGEWATGAALVSETFPRSTAARRSRFVQSSWAIGYGLAALVNLIVMPLWGWRGVFFVGVLPALFTLWIRRKVEEPEIWRRHRRPAERGRIGAAVHAAGRAASPSFITLMNACSLFGWWGLNLWVPAYLALPVERGGVGLSSSAMSLFVIVDAGRACGSATSPSASSPTPIGRKRTYVIFVLARQRAAAALRRPARAGAAPACSGRSSRSSAPATSAASAR